MDIHYLPPGRELTGSQIKRLKRLCVLFSRFEEWSVSETIESFMRDMHPEAEIRLWEGIAQVYEIEIEDRDEREYRDLYSFILGISNGSLVNVDINNKERIIRNWQDISHGWIKEAYKEDNC